MESTPASKSSLTHTLLSRANSPTSTARIFADKIQHKPLLLRPTTSAAAPTADARAQRRARRAQASAARRRRPQPLTAREKRRLCIYEIPKAERKWEIYAGLNRLWAGYMREVLGLKAEGDTVPVRPYVTPQAVGPLVASADLHGALIEVVRSRCVARVGLRGYVVRDTKFTFAIITSQNEIKTVPKEHSVFRIEVPTTDSAVSKNLDDFREKDRDDRLVFELHGQHFANRAPDRATKKIKMRGRDLQEI